MEDDGDPQPLLVWPLSFPHPSFFTFQPLHPFTFFLSIQIASIWTKSTQVLRLPLSYATIPTWKPSWWPITPLDNARHKSSIGLSDTWGLSNRGNMLFSVLFPFFYLLSFLCSFTFSIYELVKRIVCCVEVRLCDIQTPYLLQFLFC